MNRTLIIILLIVLAGGLLWYFNSTQDATGLPNPATVHCIDQGGRHQVRTDASGGEYGICVFNDGRECEEWALFQDNACAGPTSLGNPASAYCAEHDGSVEIRTDAEGGQFGVCVFADGSECEEWAFYQHGACDAP